MTREEMWEEFESQLIREVRTPITMSYNDSIKMAEKGIKEVVEKWKKRLEQEPKHGHWITGQNRYFNVEMYRCSECKNWSPYKAEKCPNCHVKMIGEKK